MLSLKGDNMKKRLWDLILYMVLPLMLIIIGLTACIPASVESEQPVSPVVTEQPVIFESSEIIPEHDRLRYYYDEVHDVCIWIFDTYNGGGIAVLPGDDVNNQLLPISLYMVK